ncbi:MAG: aldehyde dehydrogenase [Crocinitomicaceae bacterium]
MNETPFLEIGRIYLAQKAYFDTNDTKNVQFRLIQLQKFKTLIERYQNEIEAALWIDLHKSKEEAFLTEISIVLMEVKYHIAHLKKWSASKRVRTPFHLLPSSSKIVYEPLGLSLIIAPWNYPFQLLMNSLVGAISSGCCAILKPSPDTPTIAKLMQKMIQETFDENYIAVVQGGKETNTLLLQKRFDVIFFTGSSRVGKIVMKAAAENLTPVVLELGGKSPCIVGQDANITIAARRIIWGKLINAGQTCIAPDYVFVHNSVKDELLKSMVKEMKSMYGEDFKASRFYPRIVNDAAMERLTNLLQNVEIYFGGQVDKTERYISPTILDNVKPEDEIMKGEIFGPILPILTFKKIDEALKHVAKNEKPLAFYYFGKSKHAKEILFNSTSGGACINDTLMHIVNHNLPFGGVGNSGMGKYHGKESFLAFSNQRGVIASSTWLDLPFKYVPFKGFSFVKRLF